MKKIKMAPVAAAISAMALCAGASQASTVEFNDASADYDPKGNVSLGTGGSSITAKSVSMKDWSLSAYVPEGAGSLSIKAGDAVFGRFGQSVDVGGNLVNAKHGTKMDLTGKMTVQNGIDVRLNKNKSPDIRLENSLDIQAKAIEVEGGQNALSLNYSYDGGGQVPGGLLDVHASADAIKLTGGQGQAVFADGNSADATDAEGTHLTLEAARMELTGGGSYGGTMTSNAAVYACQGAAVQLLGSGAGSELIINTKPVNDPAASYFGNAALLATGGSILARYGENSRVTLNGGVVVYHYTNVPYSGRIALDIGEGSTTVIDGPMSAIDGDLTLSIRGSYRIDAPFVLTQEGYIKLDLLTPEDAGEAAGSISGEVASMYDGRIDMHLSGARNAFTGVAYVLHEGTLYMNLEKGALWNMETLADEEGFYNEVTGLTLSNGTVDLGCGGIADGFKLLKAGTLDGDGGMLRFNVILNSEKEANDHLELGTFKSGDHTVHVETHSGFEPVDMQGYLIKADAHEGGSFTADTNKLESGVYLYNYEVLSRPGENEGETYWYLGFKEAKPGEPDLPPQPLSPSGEAVAAMAGMGSQTALYLTQLLDVRKRIGEVRRGAYEGLWASVGGGSDHISGFRSTGFKQDAYRFNFGYDRRKGDWLLGFNLKAVTADQKTRGTQFSAKGDAHSEGVSLYATHTRENGGYADFVLSFDRYHDKIGTHMLNGEAVSGGYRNLGFGASVELGHQFLFENSWFAEPQAQLSYYRIWGDDFQLTNGMKVSQNNFNGLTARLGVASGKEFRNADGSHQGQLYGRLGVKHEILGNEEIHVNGIRFKEELLGTRVYYGLGAEWMLSKSVKIFGHIERENGSRYTKELDFNVGLKCLF